VAEREPSRTAIVAGIVFVLAGIAFLLEQLDVWNLEAKTLAPALLIGLGLAIIVGGRARRDR
jgi:hypothetical protein